LLPYQDRTATRQVSMSRNVPKDSNTHQKNQPLKDLSTAEFAQKIRKFKSLVEGEEDLNAQGIELYVNAHALLLEELERRCAELSQKCS